MDYSPKTIQIRSTDEMAVWFAEWCKTHDMTAGEAFAAMKQAVSEDDAMVSMPEMQKIIEDYRSYRGMIDTMFLSAVQGQHDAEAKAKDAVQKKMDALTTSLADAQNELKAAKTDKQAARKNRRRSRSPRSVYGTRRQRPDWPWRTVWPSRCQTVGSAGHRSDCAGR